MTFHSTGFVNDLTRPDEKGFAREECSPIQLILTPWQTPDSSSFLDDLSDDVAWQ